MRQETPAGQITSWLANWRNGDSDAADQLFAVIYPELRAIAERLLRRERNHHTLEPSALVNELCVRIFGSEPLEFQNRAHFLAIAAQTMRRILIDYARARATNKRGGEQERISLSAVGGHEPALSVEHLLALDSALSRLEKLDGRAARVVELRFFGGLREEDAAEVLGVSVITVKRDWKTARAWLMSQI